LQPPPDVPPRIRTDGSNPFAHHTIRVRVPATVERVLAENPDYPEDIRAGLAELATALAENQPLPELHSDAPGSDAYRRALSRRAGERWLATDWFFAETYAYRQLVERVRYWDTRRDPFRPIKLEEYASATHAEAFAGALEIGGAREERLHALLGAALFGNRIDLSFAASLERGLVAAADDWLADDREQAVRLLCDRDGPVHVICDNAGTELTLDFVLVDFLLRELGCEVVLHVKVHPTFVSDAIVADVRNFLGIGKERLGLAGGEPERACIERLAAAVDDERLTIVADAFWNGSESLWEVPAELERVFGSARLVFLKGDANYRRALNDALWPAHTPFPVATAYFPAPLLALRTLKSDPLVGLAPGRAEELALLDPTFRVNGKRGVASLGGRF
jgi:uncharacterized protein with ATP-grasp and redox domains